MASKALEFDCAGCDVRGMEDFFRLTAAILTANLITVTLVYSIILVSRGDARRAISIVAAAALTLAGLVGVYWFTAVQKAHGAVIIMTVWAIILGAVWLVRDMAFSMDQE